MLHRLPPEIIGAHLASEVLGFGAGLALSALLLGLLRRGAGKQPDARAGYYQAAAALMWNLGGLLEGLGHPLRRARSTDAASNGGGIAHQRRGVFPSGFSGAVAQTLRRKIAQVKSLPISAPNIVRKRSHFVAELHCVAVAAEHAAGQRCLCRESNWKAGGLARSRCDRVGALLLLPGRLNDFVSKFYAAPRWSELPRRP